MKEVEVRNYPIALTKEQKARIKELLEERKNPFKKVANTDTVIDEEGEQNG